MTVDQLRSVEENDSAYADANVPRLADVYSVNVEWLSGRCALRDYESLKSLRGADVRNHRDAVPGQPPRSCRIAGTHISFDFYLDRLESLA